MGLGSVQPGKKSSPYGEYGGGGVKEKLRYTSAFKPMKGGETKKIEHMEKVESQIADIPVPTDYCSPTFLQKVKTKTTSKGSQLEADTDGVNKYFSGDASLYDNFISSVSTAQDSL
jgi:hypothetical protein